jgi:hypothetical protein
MSMSNLIKTITMPTYRLEALDGVIAKLAKRAEKLGVIAPSYKVVSTNLVDVSDDNRHPSFVEFSTLELTYEVIRKAGKWSFVAKLETADMVDGVPRNRVSGYNLSEEVSKAYVTAHQNCEHCHHDRKRNATYIVTDETGKTVQVGSTCLEAYMGINPADAISSLDMHGEIDALGEDEEAFGCGSGAPRLWNLADVAAIALSLIAKNGFVSAADCEFSNKTKTGNDMATYLVGNNPRLTDWYASVKPSEENIKAATAIVERLTARILPDYTNNPTALDSFSFKLGIIINRKAAGHADMQLFAAAVNREATDIAKENGTGKVKNEWLPGAVEGSKIEVKATIAMVKEVNSSFGTSLLVKFVTVDGYPLTSFYSGKGEFNPGAAVTLKGTVKCLEENKFGKCVMLTRIKAVAA